MTNTISALLDRIILNSSKLNSGSGFWSTSGLFTFLIIYNILRN